MTDKNGLTLLLVRAKNLKYNDTPDLDDIIQKTKMYLGLYFPDKPAYTSEVSKISFSPSTIIAGVTNDSYMQSFNYGKQKLINLLDTRIEEYNIIYSQNKKNHPLSTTVIHESIQNENSITKLKELIKRADKLPHNGYINSFREIKGRAEIILKSELGEENVHLKKLNTSTYSINFPGKKLKAILSVALEELEYLEKSKVEKENNKHSEFVNTERIEELKNISNAKFDFKKLIAYCKEINYCYQNECYLAVAMITRAIIDHIPPIFNATNFQNVYGQNGTRSFKEQMTHLDKSSRKIADSYLHNPIRDKESLPNHTQVNFSQAIDVLLAEICRLTS